MAGMLTRNRHEHDIQFLKNNQIIVIAAAKIADDSTFFQTFSKDDFLRFC